jgi:hypothetical protein
MTSIAFSFGAFASFPPSVERTAQFLILVKQQGELLKLCFSKGLSQLG